MKKSVKYSGIVIAALLAVAPVVTNNVAVVNADATTQSVSKLSHSGDTKEDPIIITFTVGYPKSALDKQEKHLLPHYNPVETGFIDQDAVDSKTNKRGTLRIPFYIYVNGKLYRRNHKIYKTDAKGNFLDKDGKIIKTKDGKAVNSHDMNRIGFYGGEAYPITEKDRLVVNKGVITESFNTIINFLNVGAKGIYPNFYRPGKLETVSTIELWPQMLLKPNKWYKVIDRDSFVKGAFKTDDTGMPFRKDGHNLGKHLTPVLNFVGPNISEDESLIPLPADKIIKDDDWNKYVELNKANEDTENKQETTDNKNNVDSKNSSSDIKADNSKSEVTTNNDSYYAPDYYPQVDATPIVSNSNINSNSSVNVKTSSDSMLDSTKETSDDAVKESVTNENNNKKSSVKGSKRHSNKVVKVKRTLIHNALVYTRKGKKFVEKHVNKMKMYRLLLKGKTITTFGKPVTIKGKKYYKIGKNKYIKAVNFAKIVKFTVKGKKNAKTRIYTSTGKKTHKYVYGKRTYKFDLKKKIKRNIYYKLNGKNQWVRADKLI